MPNSLLPHLTLRLHYYLILCLAFSALSSSVHSVAADLKQIENSGQLLNIDQYRQFVKTHQALLFPAFQMQLALQRRILGVRFWERNANKRLKFSNGKYISIGNFILFVRVLILRLCFCLSWPRVRRIAAEERQCKYYTARSSLITLFFPV